ncbi:MAG: hypothetical protein K0S34_2718 [Bacillales bacterium]|nr:hypothetical protein [Bacillales bacterium]
MGLKVEILHSLIILNLSAEPREVNVEYEGQINGTDLITDEAVQLTQGENTLLLEPWGFLVIRN